MVSRPAPDRARHGISEFLLRGAIRRPRSVLALWLALVAVTSQGVPHLAIETTVESVFDRAAAAWGFYQRAQQVFGDDEIVVILIEADEPYASDALRAVEQITDALEQAPHVRRVDSLSSMPRVRAQPDGTVDLRPALAPERDIGKVAALLEGDRIAPNYLVSEDGRSFAVNLLMAPESEENIESVLDSIRRATEGFDVRISGVPVFRAETNRRLQRDLSVFVPVTIAVIGLVLLGLFASFPAMAIPLITSSLGTWLLFGIMGASGGALTISTAILPPVLLALGASYSMHIVSAGLTQGDREERAQRMLAAARPTALSGLTTAVGFVAVSLVRIPVIRDVGGYGALGVMLVLALSLSAGPALLVLWPSRGVGKRPLERLTDFASPRLARLARRGRRPVMAGFAVLTLISGLGALRIHVESDVVLWFPKRDSIRADYDAIKASLSGISPMNVVVEAAPDAAVTEPDYVAAMARLTASLEDLPEVGKAVSLADPLLQLHEGFSQDGRPIDSRAMVEQYLLLLESVDQTRDLVSNDRSMANVVLRLDHNGSEHLLSVAREAERWWRENGPVGSHAQTTGIMYEFARTENEITWGQLRGLLFATLTISGILWLTFRSVRLTVVGLIPNLVPVVAVFGLMGWAGIPLDAATALLGTLVLGIAVDDTVHVLDAFHRERQGGAAREQAVLTAIARVLPPVMATTVAVAGGFAVLGLSGFLMIRHLGYMTSGILALCLAADLLLLPALLSSGPASEGEGEGARAQA